MPSQVFLENETQPAFFNDACSIEDFRPMFDGSGSAADEAREQDAAEQEESSDESSDEELRVRRRTDQFFASASDYYDCEADTTSTLALSSSDSRHCRAFKIVCSDAVQRRNRTVSGMSALISHVGHNMSSHPSICDHRAEICVASKRALRGNLNCYRLFLSMFDSDFEHWQEVPQSLRDFIMARVGKMFLKRGIVTDGGNVNEYFQQRGGSLLQKTRFAKGWR